MGAERVLVTFFPWQGSSDSIAGRADSAQNHKCGTVQLRTVCGISSVCVTHARVVLTWSREQHWAIAHQYASAAYCVHSTWTLAQIRYVCIGSLLVPEVHVVRAQYSRRRAF